MVMTPFAPLLCPATATAPISVLSQNGLAASTEYVVAFAIFE
jgi:hypothetical protein